MAKKTVEISVEDKLRALYDLQIIDSRLDESRNTRGELPIEVEDLEIEIEGLEKAGVEVRSRLRVSESCPLILPFHVALDVAREAAREQGGSAKIGPTGRGIGPCLL